MRERIQRSLELVAKYVEDHHYKGYDPGDGLTSFLRPLTFGNLFAQRILLQVIWKSPINLRPLVGVKPGDSTKGRGFMAWGYLMRFKSLRDKKDLIKATNCLDWLDKNHCQKYPGYSWGNHFDFCTRGGCIPAGEPTIVWSGLIGQAFLEAYEQTQEKHYLDVAQSICQFILQLPRERTSTGDCLSYVAFAQSSIHNSNMLGAAMLARTWKHIHIPEYMKVAQSAMLYSCSRQLADGAWWYGEHPKNHWIDNFHTGYNLDSLKRYIQSTGDESFRPQLQKGYQYFKDTFFEESGCPRYYHNKTQPVDIQCASQAIDTFSFFGEEDPAALSIAQKVARWTINHMQDRDGHFYYRKYPIFTAKTPYFHWGQATMFKALAHLLSKF